MKAKESFTGLVTKKIIAPGSEYEYVIHIISNGDMSYILRRKNAGYGLDPFFKKYEGKTIAVKGVINYVTFFVTSVKEVK